LLSLFSKEFKQIVFFLLLQKSRIKSSEDLTIFIFKKIDEKGNAFIGFLLRYLLFGTEAKEKMCRYRVCQLIALVLDTIEEIEYLLFLFFF